MRPSPIRSFGYICALLFAISNVVRADIGVPMLFVTWPAMLAALVPVIGIETCVLARNLKRTPMDVLKPVAWANAASTIIGIPLMWFLLLVLEGISGGGRAMGIETIRQKVIAVTWQAPWLIPYDKDLHWMIPVATMVLLVPFFFMSWFVEYRITKRLLREVSVVAVSRGMFIANLASYFLLFLWALYQLRTSA